MYPALMLRNIEHRKLQKEKIMSEMEIHDKNTFENSVTFC